MNIFRARVGSPGDVQGSNELLLVPGENLRTGVKDFQAQLTGLTTLESDLLTVASAVYACDLAFKRGQREEITRSIELDLPVVNYYAFKNSKNELEMLLWTLSHDNWTIKLHRIDGQAEEKISWPKSTGVTILFSGGVDSFAGALDLLITRGIGGVQLASHVTANPVTKQTQVDLVS